MISLRRSVMFLTALILVGSVSCSQRETALRNFLTIDPSPLRTPVGQPVLGSSEGASEGLDAVLGDYYLVPTDHVTILRSIHIQRGDLALVLARVKDGMELFHAVGWLERARDTWSVGEIFGQSGDDPFAFKPEGGSGGTNWVPLLANGSSHALIGFLDPETTRLDVVGPSGELVFRDEPVDGATIIRARPWDQLRVFAGD